MRRREAEGGIASRSEIRKSVSGDAERGMMVKATPTSTFVMAQAEFTFQLFVITFDAPAQFGIIDECGEGRVLGQGRKPVYFVGAASPFGHSTSSHSTGCGVVRL